MNRIEKAYNKLADLAQKQQKSRQQFDLLSESHYGFSYCDCDFSINDNQINFCDDDEIVDTLDYGTDKLSFDAYNKRMLKAASIINDNS